MFSDFLNLDTMDKVEYIDIPFIGELTTRKVSRLEKGDWWYSTTFDSEGYLVKEESSHPLMCGSRFMYLLHYKGRMIYRRTEGGIRISKHDSSISYEWDGEGWTHEQFTIFKDLGIPNSRKLKTVIEYVIRRLKGTLLDSEIQVLKEFL